MHVPQPDISVVITTYNRPDKLAGALQALSQQDYPKERFEVIVVNDGGPPPLEHQLRSFDPQLQFRLFSQSNAGPGAGRNTGVAEARGALIAFTDDDCEPRFDWLRALKRAADAAPECLLGGTTVPGFPQVPCSAASQSILDTVYSFYNAQPQDARFFASNNMAVPAGPFRALGGFDARFRVASEDRDLCERWRTAGRRIVHVPDAIVCHCQELSFRRFVRQHFRYGRGASRFHRERMRRGVGRLRDHTGLYRYWREWLLRPWREMPGWSAARLQLLLVTWQVTNAAGFVYGCLFDRD